MIKTILIIDDSAVARCNYRNYLNHHCPNSYSLIEVETLESGLRLCREEKPDAILLDDNLPDGNALEFLERMKQLGYSSQLPVIVIAEKEEVSSAIQAIKRGAQDYLEKSTLSSEKLWRSLDNLSSSIQAERDRKQAVLDLEKQNQKLQAQIETEGRLDRLVKHIPGVIYQFRLRVDGTSHFPYASIGIQDIYGVTPEEVREDASAVFKVLHPDDFDRVSQSILDSAKQLTPWYCEYRVYLPDGRILWLLGHSTPRREPDGSTIWYGYIQDISARKLAAIALQQLNSELEVRVEKRTAALRESEARNRAILNALPDLLLLLKPDGTCLECIMPSTINEPEYITIQSHISEVLSPETIALQLQVTQRAIATGELQLYEHKLSKFGRDVYEEVRITPYSEELVLVIVRDITARKQAEELLRKSDSHLKTAQRISKLGSWEFDLAKSKLTWSDEIFRIYGLEPSPNPPSYDELKQYIYPDDWEHFDQTVQNAINFAQSYDIEHRVVQPDGTLIFLMARGEMVYDSAGQLTHIIGTAMDISDRKLAEQKIQQTANQLEAINRELESFSYSVSHDLRAPLRHMNGFVGALNKQLEKHQALNDPKVVHYLQVIEGSSQKMGKLIDGLLTLSRFGRRPMESKLVSIRKVVDDAIAIAKTDINFNPSVEFAIGELSNVMGDSTLLQQVFLNLITNAIKFSRNRSMPRIEIGSLPDGTIKIKDNGVGFQMEYADKLFGAFQRLHTEIEFEGTGIGLAIVHRIMQRHGGSIWAEGYPDRGATFFLRFRDTV